MSEGGEQKGDGEIVPFKSRLQLKADSWQKPPTSLDNILLADKMGVQFRESQKLQKARNETYAHIMVDLRNDEEKIIASIQTEIKKGNSRLHVLLGSHGMNTGESMDMRLNQIFSVAEFNLGVEGCAEAFKKWWLEKPRNLGKVLTVKYSSLVKGVNTTAMRALWLEWA